MPVSYQAQVPVLGLVLPSNSPGVHTLWLPVIPMQIGLVLKPGPQEPWTPYRMAEAFFQAGVPSEAISIYPGVGESAPRCSSTASAAMIFGGTATVERYSGNPRVQVHGPGFTKILLGDDVVDNWEKYLDMMVDSVLRQQRPRLHQLLRRSGRPGTRARSPRRWRSGWPDRAAAAGRPDASLAAFTVPGAAEAISASIEARPAGRRRDRRHREVSRGSSRRQGRRCDYLRPTVMHCDSPDAAIAKKEYMFPFVTVVECPQEKMLEAIGPTLVCTRHHQEARAAPPR